MQKLHLVRSFELSGERCSCKHHSTVLRMLSNFIGEEKFLKGVSIYLKKHLFANSVTRDLWEGIQEASGKSRQGQGVLISLNLSQASTFRR